MKRIALHAPERGADESQAAYRERRAASKAAVQRATKPQTSRSISSLTLPTSSPANGSRKRRK